MDLNIAKPITEILSHQLSEVATLMKILDWKMSSWEKVKLDQ